MHFHLGRRKNETGQWTTTISAIKDSVDVTESMNMEVIHKITDCGGRKVLNVKGIFFEVPIGLTGVDGNLLAKLRFHKMGGKNTYFVNEYRTAFRQNDAENNGVVFSSHPLKMNQLIEVQIDRATTKFPYGLGVGITTNDPNELAIPDHMNSLKVGTWMYYDRRLFNNSTMIVKDIGRNIDELQRGDQIGIMVKKPGVLHIFINGNDMGPNMAGIPDNVYGVIELRGKTVQVSMIEKHAKLMHIM
ncbi:neuralized-like protein 4 [Hetaerina americana]|uniref:neuralized-like protein 4 n=1 Tax=Hetaerina americana TaxID=62018 RepID=UPI003A7F5B9B